MLHDGYNQDVSKMVIFGEKLTLFKNSMWRSGFNPDDLEYLTSNYVPYDNDVFIVTYPSCGTTWVGDICNEITNQFDKKERNLNDSSPSAEYLMLFSQSRDKFKQYIDNTRNTLRFWKLHSPYHLLPINYKNGCRQNDNNLKANMNKNSKNSQKKVKIIIVSRNPKDACISFYFHKKNQQIDGYNGDWNTFFSMWIGNLAMTDNYFNFYKEWYNVYANKNKNNNENENSNKYKYLDIHWIYYENMKQDTQNEVIRLANFLGFDQNNYVNNDDQFYKKIATIIDNTNVKKTRKKWERKMAHIKNFVRKGIIGDWKNHLTFEQSKMMDYLIQLNFYNEKSFKYYKDLQNKALYLAYDPVSKL